MSVFKRKTTKGESEFFHYRFMRKGRSFSGVCIGCKTKREALAYEDGKRQQTNSMAEQKTVKALMDNFRDEITGTEKVLLSDVEKSIPKIPSKKAKLSERHLRDKTMHWTDFHSFMKDNYSEIKYINQITKSHAMGYWENLRLNGKYKKDIKYKAGKKTKTYRSKLSELSARTCNMYLGTLKSIFSFFIQIEKIINNPFDGIYKLTPSPESREAFSKEELLMIQKNADDFIYPIFIIGLNTAFREGDICTLRWSDVDLQNMTITRKTKKAGVEVTIPIMPPLFDFLQKQYKKTGDSEYVLPEHAEMYEKNHTGITWRFKSFLESIGIETTKKIEGRSKAVSTKDVHSFRHTFCYLAGVNNIPLVIVQSIVGHMTLEMTAHYQKHATLKDKKEQLEKMPEFMRLSTDQKVIETNTSDHKIQEITEILTAKRRLSKTEKQIVQILNR